MFPLLNQFALSQGRSPPSMSSSRSFARSTGCAENGISATAAAAKNERASFIPKDSLTINQVAYQEMPHAVLSHISRSYVVFSCAKPMSVICATDYTIQAVGPRFARRSTVLPAWLAPLAAKRSVASLPHNATGHSWSQLVTAGHSWSPMVTNT